MSNEELIDDLESEATPPYLAFFEFEDEQDGRTPGVITWRDGRQTPFADCSIPADYVEPVLPRKRQFEIVTRPAAYTYSRPKEADPLVRLMVASGFLLALGTLVFLAIISK